LPHDRKANLTLFFNRFYWFRLETISNSAIHMMIKNWNVLIGLQYYCL
jgi:hypothetical protein